MDAYKTLELDEILNNEKASNTPISANALIKVRAKKLLDERIYAMNQILSEEASISEKLMKIESKLREMVTYLRAYDSIANVEARMMYKLKGSQDIEKLTEEVYSIFDRRRILLPNNGKTEHVLDAFQILGLEGDDQTQREDDYYRNKLYRKISMSLADSKFIDMKCMETIVTELLKNYWAYSKIAEAKQREIYRYKSIAKRGDLAARNTGTPKIAELRDKPACAIDYLSDENYGRILIAKVMVLRAQETMISETKGYGYFVQKISEEGETSSQVVFSNIDMERLKNIEDTKYRMQVQELLLSDKAMEVAKEYFGNYVGELSFDGEQVIFDPECVGLCRELQEIEKKKATEGKTTRDKSTSAKSAGDKSANNKATYTGTTGQITNKNSSNIFTVLNQIDAPDPDDDGDIDL